MTLLPLTKYAALDAASVDLSKMDGTDKVTILVTIEAAVLSKIRDRYSGDDLNEVINFILDQKTFEPNFILKYEGKTKIRYDVLEKLKRISDFMETQTTYPSLKLQQVKIIVKDALSISVLTASTRRTYDKYIKSINDCIYSCSGNRLSLYDSIDCSCFVRIVNDKLAEKHS